MRCGPELRVGYRVAQCTQRTQCSHCELSVGLQCPAVLRARAVGPEDRPDLLGRARAPRQLRVVRSNAQDKPCSAVQCSAAQRSGVGWGAVGWGAVKGRGGKQYHRRTVTTHTQHTCLRPSILPSTTEHDRARGRTELVQDGEGRRLEVEREDVLRKQSTALNHCGLRHIGAAQRMLMSTAL
jgi:hypothetical protein